MERAERLQLEAIERQLSKNLSTVRGLLKTAREPKRVTDKQAKERAKAICEKLKGIKVTDARLRELTNDHGLPYHAVGALFAAGYLKRTAKGITLGARGVRVVRQEGQKPKSAKRRSVSRI